MRMGRVAKKSIIVAVSCLVLVLAQTHAQKKPASAASGVTATRASLILKAHALDARGRPDMAIQLWQQILLSEPANAEALAGLARDLKLTGANDKANDALSRLRQVNPNDPNLAKIQALTSTHAQSDQLRQAGDLARGGKVEDAMRIYRQLYGDHPPDGDIALAYYQTLYGTANGKIEAIAGMRALAARNPGDGRCFVELGTMLTYDPRTRLEGIRMLEAHAKEPNAQAALRQALLWDASNPAVTGELRNYLKDHPQDSEIASHLKEDENKLAQMNSGIARTPAEHAAFSALNAHHNEEAQKRFLALLEEDPKNGRAAAGMGFLRMQEKNFSGAISYLSQAEQNGYKDRSVESALESSRFWSTMNEAAQALDDGQYDVSEARYKAALAMNARSPEALNGLAGLLVRQEQYPAAAGVYEQLVKMQPGNLDGWRGLFLAYARNNENQKAMATQARFPASVKTALNRDPDYLRTLAAIDQSEGKPAEAQRVLAIALNLPFPNNGSTLRDDTKLQYAGLLLAAHHENQAAELYAQVLDAQPGNRSAWMGLVSAHHQMGQDGLAIADVEKMPAQVYEASLADPGFLSMLGSIYQQANQYEVAQGLLERSARQQIAAGGKPSVQLRLQLAAIYMLRNNTQQAYGIYRQVLAEDPERAEAWKGLITTLQSTNRNSEALQEVAQIPASVRRTLETDNEFVQLEASLYAATGDTQNAIAYMTRVEQFYSKTRTMPPAAIEIQHAWLLFNIGNDRALYNTLMKLGGRKDMTAAQRESVQNIWASWSVKRAQVAIENGNPRRAVDILDAAYQAFPNNLTVRKAVAGGYSQVGRTKEALAIFKTIPMQDATSGDFQGAVGAALTANDKAQAELWLRQALERYPHDPAILGLAARYEQARGDNQRAADYYRASLAAMPSASPMDRLAHTLVYPEQDERARKVMTAADLQRLLDPSAEPFPKTAKIPALPAYGPDPYDGSAPVILTPQRSTTSTDPLPALTPQDPRPVITEIPAAQPENSDLLHQQSVTGQEDALLYTVRPAVHYTGGISANMVRVATTQAQDATPILLNPPHSLASDTWKGLIFSLIAANHKDEALAELDRIPTDVRSQLEADVEFVQGIASLYSAVGDVPHAMSYLNRVEEFYLLHRSAAPAGLEVQHAWLLYNLQDDPALYAVLGRLDARSDLTEAQRQDVQTLWADWAVRRASAAMKAGNVLRGVQILLAASQDFPNSLTVRRAVAGAYVRLGRAQDAVTLYKSIPMENATAGDYQGAIAAALAATDMAQAEAWLRQALSLYPSDPLILGTAAQFEQKRGNNERASGYWRAALAAMPPGSSVKSLDAYVPLPAEGYRPPAAGDTRRLLDPRSDPPSVALPLPAYSKPFHGTASSVEAPAGGQNFIRPIANPSGAQSGFQLIEQASRQPAIFLPVAQVTTGQKNSKSAKAPVRTPRLAASASANGLRITSQPMGELPAEVLTQFANQTDSQLTQGSATVLHAAPAKAPVVVSSGHAVQNRHYESVQYTPSAQEAATGAFSAPRQGAVSTSQTVVPAVQQQPAIPASKPVSAPTSAPKQTATHHSNRKPRPAQFQDEAMASSQPVREAALPAEPQPLESYQQADLPQAPVPATGAGLTDEELEQRSLPPLRGPWVRVQRNAHSVSPREDAELQLQSIESGYSSWLGGTGLLNYRSGTLGYDHLAALEAPFEASICGNYNVRLSIIAKPVFLDSGQADGTAQLSVLESTTDGTKQTVIAEPIGTLTGTDTTIPAQQNAVGLGGEVQLAFPHLAIAAGTTPYGFLIQTVTARMLWKPGNGPFTFSFNRDSVKDSQLAYAGLRDPAGNSLGVLGQIWGGVMANQGNLQYARGDEQSGYYFGVGGEYLAGYKVKDNSRIDGSGGAYWRVLTVPEYGSLNIGANFFAMHYANNQDAFTHGMGGYFSPQGYFLANVPFTWTGHYLTHWHYNIAGGLGVQAFQEDQTKLWPLQDDVSLETSEDNPLLPDKTSVGPNYDLHSQAAYQISPHWFAGGYFGANNTRNYSSVQVGFYVRYLFREQPSTATGPTGLFPSEGIRPFAVP